MTAASITGVGQGASHKLTVKELSILANGPSIFLSGYATSEAIGESSPPSTGGSVSFSAVLPGGSENYVVSLTTINGGKAYVVNMNETEGDFSGFDFQTETDCDVMYIVANVGVRPNITTTT